MIIQWNPNLILDDWKVSRSGIHYRENVEYIQKQIAKITIDKNNSVIFWDEFEFCRDIYIQKPRLTIEEIKTDVDQFLFQMIDMKAFL